MSGLRAAAPRVLALLAVAYLLACALAWRFAERLIFQPPPATYDLAHGIGRIPVEGRDSIAVRWLPNPAATHTILFSHGNAEDLGALEESLLRLRAAGFAILAYDYRGYGRSSPRRPTERSAYADHAAAYRHLTVDLGVPASRVILHGRSLGGGVASELAARCPVAGLVLESTFTSAFRVVAPELFPFDRFATRGRLHSIRVPILVVHGTADRVIPLAHGRTLAAAAPVPVEPVWVTGAGHDDVAAVGGARYFSALRAFAAILPSRPRSSRTCSPTPGGER